MKEEILPPEEPIVAESDIFEHINLITEAFPFAHVKLALDESNEIVASEGQTFMIRSSKLQAFANTVETKLNPMEIIIYRVDFFLEFNEEGEEEIGYKIVMDWK